jgi:hypothetical protein
MICPNKIVRGNIIHKKSLDTAQLGKSIENQVEAFGFTRQ